MPNLHPTSSATAAFLDGCVWTRGAGEAQSIWQGIGRTLRGLEPLPLAGEEQWGFFVGFSRMLSDPLASHLGGVQDSEPALRSVLVSLLTDGPNPNELQSTLVLLETVRQTAGFLSGETEHPALSGLRGRIGSEASERLGAMRRAAALGVLREMRWAVEESEKRRPRGGGAEILDLLETCILPLIHSRLATDSEPDLAVIGAELGVEVDGLLLQEVRLAVEACFKSVRGDSSELGQRLASAYAADELYFAHLASEDCVALLNLLQSKVRVRDLTGRGVERSRAKRLLKMQSAAVLFTVFRQLHLQLKRFDLLVGLCARLVPVSWGAQGAYTPYGGLPHSVRWAFLGPGRSQVPTRCAVVVADLAGLIREASRRASRDGDALALTALWSSGEALALEAEAVGGLALIQGSRGLGLFSEEGQAQEFARRIRERYQVPIDLSQPGANEAIVLPPVEVALTLEQGPVYGYVGQGVEWFWVEQRIAASSKRMPEAAPKGFSILTEIGEDDDTEVQAEETFVSEDGASFFLQDGGVEPAADTLDAFFLPSKSKYSGGAAASKTVDLGIDADALVEILRDYGVVQQTPYEWSFGTLEGSTLSDHHGVRGKDTLESAIQALILKKFGEGFAPRSDSFLELADTQAFYQLPEALLRQAFQQLTGAQG